MANSRSSTNIIKIKMKQRLKSFLNIFILVTPYVPSPLIKFLQRKTIYEPKIKRLKIDKSNIPLFDTVFFEVRTRCNGTCPFCSASIQNDDREDKSMPMKLHKKVINELKEMNFSGRIAYHVNNDPLIFSPLPDFVKYARKNLPNVWIQILTNGKALTLEKAERLLRAGINELSINFYNDDFSAKLPKPIQDVRDKLLPKFFKPEQIKARTVSWKHGNKNTFRFYVSRRKATEILTTRGGTAPNKKEKSKIPRGFCEYPFRQFNITTDGRVSKCCTDFYFSDPMGNVNEKNIMDIWAGKKFNHVRYSLLQGNRDVLKNCKECDFYGVKNINSKIGKFIYFITS